MKKTIRTAFAIMLSMTCMGACAQWGARADPNPSVKLKDAYKNYFMIGVALNQRNVSNQDQINLVKAEFNSITAENDMKPGKYEILIGNNSADKDFKKLTIDFK